jgi:hypothetical protein
MNQRIREPDEANYNQQQFFKKTASLQFRFEKNNKEAVKSCFSTIWGCSKMLRCKARKN